MSDIQSHLALLYAHFNKINDDLVSQTRHKISFFPPKIVNFLKREYTKKLKYQLFALLCLHKIPYKSNFTPSVISSDTFKLTRIKPHCQKKANQW